MASLRTPLYRDFLTPALHKRFSSAALITLVLCYAEAILIADKSSSELDPHIKNWLRSDIMTVFWFWFPIGPAGIRTLLIFISVLSLFVLRVAQLHLGTTEKVLKPDSSTEKSFRHPNVSITLHNFRNISVPIQHFSNFCVVPVLGVVVR